MQFWQSVEAEFGRIFSTRQQLRECVDELKVLNKNLELILRSTCNFWTDETGKVMVDKGILLISEEEDELLRIDEIVCDLEKTSDSLYRAENINYELGVSRRY